MIAVVVVNNNNVITVIVVAVVITTIHYISNYCLRDGIRAKASCSNRSDTSDVVSPARRVE